MSEGFSPLDRDRLSGGKGKWRVCVFRETESTNDLVLKAGEGGEPEGLVIFAEKQTRGRGQFGRQWSSEAGLGLWFSLLLRPRWPVQEIAGMTPVIAVAVALALRDFQPAGLYIRKPNDIYVRDRKVSGILSEARSGSEVFVAVGIGINVNHRLEDFPLELQSSATSLAMESEGLVNREAVALAVLDSIGSHYDAQSPPSPEILEVYESLSRRGGCDTLLK